MKNDMINIGIDIGGSHIALGLVNIDGEIIFKVSFDFPANASAENIINEIVKYIIMLNNKSIEYNKTTVSNIGIGIPGIINSKKGMIEFSPNIPQFKHLKIAETLTKKLRKNKIRIPIYIGNDANVAAFGEYKFGWGKYLKKQNLLHLTLGTGVGGGIILNNKIYIGCSNNAGELGHITIKYDGRLCKCGNYGCIEAYCNAAGLMQTAKDYIKETNNYNILKYCRNNINFLTPEIISRAAKHKENTALEIFKIYGSHLGIGVASLINIFNIELITIGGGISQAGDFFINSLIAETRARAFKRPVEHCSIKISKLGANAGLIGASILYSQF